MTRDRIKEISEKAAVRVADPNLGTQASAEYVARLAELKKQKEDQQRADQTRIRA